MRYLLSGRIQFPFDRVGDILITNTGDRFVIYRETVLQPAVKDPFDDCAILIFRMKITNQKIGVSVRHKLFNSFANVATPFFTGMPGFRRKVWLAGDRSGEFLELYEWASTEDADRFITVLKSLLQPFNFAGSASFEIIEGQSVDQYIAAHSGDDTGIEHPDRQRWQQPTWTLIILVIVAFIAGYLAGKHGFRKASVIIFDTKR